jgi:peptide deformylase
MAEDEEGCLSVPTIRLMVKRPASVSVRAQDIDGKEYSVERAEGLLARVLQHEIDHLNGILFIDHVSPLQRRLLNGKLKKLAKSGGKKK